MPRTVRLVVVLLALAAVAAPLALRSADIRAYTVQTVEMSELGFNPAICRMNRREYLRFQNVSDKVMRVGRPSSFAGKPPFDVQEIQPGGYSNEYVFEYGGSTVFIDVDNPSRSMTVITPVFVETWDPICTPTPLVTPPPPPPPPPPPSATGCGAYAHCLRLPLLARD